MGGLIAKALDRLSFGGNQQSRILMVGLDAAGKTSILYKMKLNELVQTIPTIGKLYRRFSRSSLDWKISGASSARVQEILLLPHLMLPAQVSMWKQLNIKMLNFQYGM